MPKQVSRAGAELMSKSNSNPKVFVVSPSHGATQDETVQAAEAIIREAAEPVKEVEMPKRILTMQEKILKVETLGLVIEKRAKLVQTRAQLDRFQTSSNDFSCNLKLVDADGNAFTTSFTPGILKVLGLLKDAFDQSITDVETQINF